MATIKFFMGIVCLTIIFSSGRVFGGIVVGYDNDGDYLRIVATARKEIGTREGNVPNSGPKVSEYLRYVGINFPAPWCAAWVSYVFGEAGYSKPKTPWSPDLFPLARQVKTPRPGHVLGIYFTALKRIGHCGIVEKLQNDWCFSIEGNTNLNGTREGDGVYRRIRHIRSIYRFADWTEHN